MLYILTSSKDPLFRYLQDDPVRSNISAKDKLGEHREVFMLISNKNGATQGIIPPLAIVCVKYSDQIPSSVSDLLTTPLSPSVAVFYTIWSYERGAGSLLLKEVFEHLLHFRREVKRFVTLSPKTDLARQFHLKNGATVYRENEDSVNYVYTV